MKNLLTAFILLSGLSLSAQTMTPELLWQLGRVSANGISPDGTRFVYTVSTPDVAKNDFSKETFAINVKTGEVMKIDSAGVWLPEPKLSPDGKWKLTHKAVKVKDITGEDYYPDLAKSDALIYDQLHFRHWDTWKRGLFNHVFITSTEGSDSKDIMSEEPYDCPTVPFGGNEDYIWTPDGKAVIYVSKKRFGTEYVLSTNTDLYRYDMTTGITENLTADNPGYDTHPAFSSDGQLAWLSMPRNGYESDKNDVKVDFGNEDQNLTGDWDGSVRSFIWSEDGETIYFNAATGGTIQLFSVNVPARAGDKSEVQQITDGVWDITDLVGFANGKLICGRTDMNHAREYYAVDVEDGSMEQLTRVNDEIYAGIRLSKIEKRMITTTDDKEMVTWVIYPPDFDPSREYPTLLYTQGGPQSPLSQFYSFRWNFQVMAAQGYIIVAPNRRGMPGHGVAWNEQISKDYGGQNIEDYLSAIDSLAKMPFVDEQRLGCVGASYGGYSVFYLAGVHEGRFKSFISHDGIFNLRSMYGTTEELFFVNWDLGGPYWDEDNAAAQKSFNQFNPINKVGNWDTPIMIIQGGKDFRVTEGQAFEAFTAAQVLGLKSRLLYFPEENHWVLNPQNGMVWQKEFFRWLDETLK